MKYAVSIILIFAAISCGNRQKVSNRILKKSYISVETSPCFGACPVYKLEIFSDGTMLLQNKRFTNNEGTFTSQLTIGEHKETVYALHTANWMGYKSEYRSGYTDLPSTFLRYSERQGDTVSVNFELEAAPVELKEIALMLDSIRTSEKWTASQMH